MKFRNFQYTETLRDTVFAEVEVRRFWWWKTETIFMELMALGIARIVPGPWRLLSTGKRIAIPAKKVVEGLRSMA